jgi:hypothetical protein
MTSILKVSEIQDPTNGNSALTVDTAGRIKAPQTPLFMAICQTPYAMTQTYTELVYEKEDVDIGGNYNNSNGRFTAPIDGLYEFGYASIGMQNATCYRFRLRINGADPTDGLREQRLDNNSSGGNSYPNNNEYVAYLQLTAGQYVSVFHRADAGSVNGYADAGYRYVYFRGKLII